MIALARGLGLPTVVEGVETEEQLELLRRVGADGAQGFLIARPMPAAAVAAWAAAWRNRLDGAAPAADPAVRSVCRPCSSDSPAAAAAAPNQAGRAVD